MSRFCFCNCPAGFSAEPERHAPDCPGRSGAGKARTPVPATTPALKVSGAEELEAVLHWRGKHAQAIRERDALQLRLNAADQRIDELTAQQAESRMITLSGCEFSEHELLRTAVRMVTGTSRRGTLRWVAMKDAFCCGSGVAHALCRRFGFDPDETVKP